MAQPKPTSPLSDDQAAFTSARRLAPRNHNEVRLGQASLNNTKGPLANILKASTVIYNAEHIRHQQYDMVGAGASCDSIHAYSKITTLPTRKNLIVFVLAVILFSAAQIVHSVRMVRLCIASVDPVKLSSQCVMCNRREFPLTVIDCTGMTKVNQLISNPLSVQEATCLIYNCRRQVPDVKPEPYHGSVSSAVRTNYPSTSGSRIYETVPSTGMFGGYMNQPPITTRYGGYGSAIPQGMAMQPPIFSAATPRGLIGGPNLMANGQQVLPYAILPAPYPSLFGARKYKAALVPLFK